MTTHKIQFIKTSIGRLLFKINTAKILLKNNTKAIAISFGLIILLGMTSCEDFVQVDPPKTSLSANAVFENDKDALSVVAGVYSRMYQGSNLITSSITTLTGMYSDELINHYNQTHYMEIFQNQITASNSNISSMWAEFYRYIYTANAILEGIEGSDKLSEAVKKVLEGEARFIRAFCYFYLVNLFGDVPIVTATDYNENSVLSRNTVTEVYDLIINDLLIAEDILDKDYQSSQRIRPNAFTVSALLARAYLYTEDWANAELMAGKIIDEVGLYNLDADLNNVFLIASTETIWQVEAVFSPFNTFDGINYILTRKPTYGVSMTPELANAFDPDDNRSTHWVGFISPGGEDYYFAYKYKVRYSYDSPTEYLKVFRLAEQYLIRAEARAQQGDITGAQADINAIRNRAGLTDTPANDVNSLLLAIEQEKRFELFVEWGHRWFDLKRTNRAEAVLTGKPNLDANDLLFPIPLQEILNNPNMTQNPGY